MIKENTIEEGLIHKLSDLKYTYRPDISDKNALEANFKEKFEALNLVILTETEFKRLKDEIINADVFASSKLLRQRNTFIREDDSSLHYILVNIINTVTKKNATHVG